MKLGRPRKICVETYMFSGHQTGESPVACCVSSQRYAPRNSDGLAVVGYARAYQRPGSLEAQAEALAAVGAIEVYSDDAKGAAVIKPGLDAVINRLRPGECVVVASLDRLAWREDHLREIIDTIGARQAHLWSLAEHFDTRSHSDIFTIMRALDAFASRVRIAREAEGRPPKQQDRRQKIDDDAWAEALKRLDAGETTAAQVAKAFGVARSTISRRQKAITEAVS